MVSARRSVARLLNCTAKRVIFTGGGSEANNLAIKGATSLNGKSSKHIITSCIEHPSVINTFKALEQDGFETTFLPVNSDGLVEVKSLKQALWDNTILVSIMSANNETGVIQPIKELAILAHKQGILFHCDAVQAAGKIPIDVQDLDVDLLTISAHKFYGPKGIGVLYASKGVELSPLINGGKQENNLRAGTENVLAIAGLGKAADLAVQRLADMKRITKLRDHLEDGIKKILPDANLNGHRDSRVPVTLNMTLPEMRGESIVLAMDQKGVALSSGSACRAGSPDPSHALPAMGLSEEQAHCSVRFSLGIHTTNQEITQSLERFRQVIDESKLTVRFIPCR